VWIDHLAPPPSLRFSHDVIMMMEEHTLWR
jgi:hypothetical protein